MPTHGRWGLYEVDGYWDLVPQFDWAAEQAQLYEIRDLDDIAPLMAAAAGLLVLDPATLRAALEALADAARLDNVQDGDIDRLLANLTAAPEQPR